MTTVLVLSGSIARDDIPSLCERARAGLEDGRRGPVICDVGGLVSPDAVTIDALARLQLLAGRRGRRLWLRHPNDSLRELLALVGLTGQLPVEVPLRGEPVGHAEEGEQSGRVEEEAHTRDPPA
jgi:ABC-type transporter Mla MlaB component